jgi:hypothetical protein
MDVLNIYSLQSIHAEMCVAWSIDPRQDPSEIAEMWFGDERPPWNPIWNDFMLEIPFEHYEPLYNILYPSLQMPSLSDVREIPLEMDHMRRIKAHMDNMDDMSMSLDIDPEMIPAMIDEAYYAIAYPDEVPLVGLEGFQNDQGVSLLPRALFQEEEEEQEDEEEARERRLEDCRKGFAMVEESVSSGVCLSEGQYLELAQIFKRLSA